MKRFVVSAIALCAMAAFPSAQNRMSYSVVSADSGHVALGLAIWVQLARR
jgi:hypothetical protein